MHLRKGILGGVVGVVSLASVAMSGTAVAAFPNFSDCPRASSSTCLDIQSNSGSITIKGFNVPLDHSLEIRGGLQVATGNSFVPPTGTNGFFATPVDVPGGLLGIDLPIAANRVTATAVLAGPASSIHVDLSTLGLQVPILLKLTNPLIGPGCQIGTTSSPVILNLITGTTSPPAPNRPISGHVGTVGVGGGGTYLGYIGNENVDNSFSVPGASGCGLGLGLINAIVDAKLKLPSTGGNNTMIIDNDVAIQGA